MHPVAHLNFTFLTKKFTSTYLTITNPRRTSDRSLNPQIDAPSRRITQNQNPTQNEARIRTEENHQADIITTNTLERQRLRSEGASRPSSLPAASAGAAGAKEAVGEKEGGGGGGGGGRTGDAGSWAGQPPSLFLLLLLGEEGSRAGIN
jgi:hypothetical protein